MSSMQFDKTSQAGDDLSASNVLVCSDRRLKTFLQKMSIVSADISIADFLVIFMSVCDMGNRVLSCSERKRIANCIKITRKKSMRDVKTQKIWSHKY
jgi:hypothetical protein